MPLLSTCKSIFNYDDNDERVEDASRKYYSKSSVVYSRKRNHGELPFSEHKSRLRVGQRTIPVDKIYLSQPCSTPFSGNQHQRRAHAIDPEDSDNGKCQESENSSFSRFT